MVAIMRQRLKFRCHSPSRALVITVIALLSLVAPLSLHSADYLGNVGKQAARFILTWNDDGSVEGTYSYPARNGVVYALHGNNHAEGKLYLEEYTGSALTARCFLEKTLTNGVILWSGIMQNLDGREFAMSFSRERPATAEPTWEAVYLQEVNAAMNGLPEEIIWSEFPEAARATEMVPVLGDGAFIPTKILTFQVGAGWTAIRVVCGIPQPDNIDALSYTGREITLKIAREIPLPREAVIGEQTTLFVSRDGVLQDVYLPSLVITHWRKTLAGPVEIRGALDLRADPVMARLASGEVTGVEAGRLLAAIPSVALVPDKLAIDEIPTGEFSFRNMRVSRLYGLVLQLTDAGPGIIEVESISLEDPVGEIPWIFLGTEVPGALVPPTQWTREAG